MRMMQRVRNNRRNAFIVQCLRQCMGNLVDRTALFVRIDSVSRFIAFVGVGAVQRNIPSLQRTYGQRILASVRAS